MKKTSPRWILLVMVAMVAAAALLAAADSTFRPGPASSYATKQTNENVTVAAVAYDTEDLARSAFGKTNPNQYGVLPVLVVIQNDTGQALRMSNIEVDYIGPDDRRIEATPAGDLQYTLGGPKRPNPAGDVPLPIPIRIKHKNPLSSWEFEGRAFAAKMLPAKEAANGFFYFQVKPLPGAKFYLTGMVKAADGQGIFYYEIPLEIHH
jgi:hypothetical protein